MFLLFAIGTVVGYLGGVASLAYGIGFLVTVLTGMTSYETTRTTKKLLVGIVFTTAIGYGIVWFYFAVEGPDDPTAPWWPVLTIIAFSSGLALVAGFWIRSRTYRHKPLASYPPYRGIGD